MHHVLAQGCPFSSPQEPEVLPVWPGPSIKYWPEPLDMRWSTQAIGPSLVEKMGPGQFIFDGSGQLLGQAPRVC